jgi:hypothetical protein
MFLFSSLFLNIINTSATSDARNKLPTTPPTMAAIVESEFGEH